MTDANDVLTDLAALPEAAVVYAPGMCELLGRTKYALRRAVARGELPPPIRLMGRPAWIAGAVVRHLKQRQDEATRQQAAMAARIARLAP